MPRKKLRLGWDARIDWNGKNHPSDAPFVVYLGEGLYLGPALGRLQRDRGMVAVRLFPYALLYASLEEAESGVRLATLHGFISARVVPQSQVYR